MLFILFLSHFNDLIQNKNILFYMDSFVESLPKEFVKNNLQLHKILIHKIFNTMAIFLAIFWRINRGHYYMLFKKTSYNQKLEFSFLSWKLKKSTISELYSQNKIKMFCTFLKFKKVFLIVFLTMLILIPSAIGNQTLYIKHVVLTVTSKQK